MTIPMLNYISSFLIKKPKENVKKDKPKVVTENIQKKVNPTKGSAEITGQHIDVLV